MLNQYSHFQFSYDESRFIYLSGKSELILYLYPQMLVMKQLFCMVNQQELLFLLFFTSALNCVGFLESSVVRHSPRHLLLYHSECARAPVALPDIFKHALPLSWS